MSAKQCRMSPTRYVPVVSGDEVGRAQHPRHAPATSCTVTPRPLPTLMTWPAAAGARSARRQARATSCTLTKSRRCWPSSKISGGRSLSNRDAKIASTPVYGLDSAWRGPYTLKKRSATVGMP